MKTAQILLPVLLILAGACIKQPEVQPAGNEDETYLVSLTLPSPEGGNGAALWKSAWKERDRILIGGVPSDNLDPVGIWDETATFHMTDPVTPPFSAFWPENAFTDGKAIFPAYYSSDDFPVDRLPYCGYSAKKTVFTLNPLYAVIRLPLKKGKYADPVVAVLFSSEQQVSGAFGVQPETRTLTETSSAAADRQVAVALHGELSATDPLDVYIAVPARTYEKGYEISVVDIRGRRMLIRQKNAITLYAEEVFDYPALAFAETDVLEDFDFSPFGNIGGRVTDTAGTPLGGVVVSDGRRSVRTDADGRYLIASDPATLKYVFVSTPAGYQPPLNSGLPVFYRKTEGLSAAELMDIDFSLTPVSQQRYTVLMTADPQPRSRTAGYDNIGYHSLDCCEDLYRDLKETAATIQDRPVYGICLGDVIHENTALYADYLKGLSTVGYPTYNVIGNHDNVTTAKTDAEGASYFESCFGPRNYSFDLGSIHYVVLDNLIMYVSDGALKSYYQGLTDEIWNWLKGDLALVPKERTVAVCTHSPMFMTQSGTDRSLSGDTRHGKDYAALLSSFAKVYAWAGHTHTTFNYVYPANGMYPNIEVHTLSRSTGELWTNEYISSGTPRGYTVINVDGDKVEWYFKPTRYQTGAYTRTTAPPSYRLRDWTYNGDGVAIWRGEVLDERYQMHLYPRGTYTGNYLYANVFLYDQAWGDVYFTPTGGSPVKMELVTESGRYEAAQAELNAFYKSDSSTLAGSSYKARTTGEPNTLFRTETGEHGAGTVSVTDRFGKTWSQEISW